MGARSTPLDMSAEAIQFANVQEAVGEYALDETALIPGSRCKRHQLGLQVGRNARIRSGADVDRARPASSAHDDVGAARIHFRARADEQIEKGRQVRGDGSAD